MIKGGESMAINYVQFTKFYIVKTEPVQWMFTLDRNTLSFEKGKPS